MQGQTREYARTLPQAWDIAVSAEAAALNWLAVQGISTRHRFSSNPVAEEQSCGPSCNRRSGGIYSS